MPLRALILGSGFAGQGHTEAFRDAGVEIVGMASRTREVTEQVAADMDIPYATTDWQKALSDLQPDIVAVGTPGGAHLEPTMAALDQGCHIYCDKPLATSTEDAKKMYLKAEEAGVKTAFSASYRYQPHALLAKALVAEGKIGDPLEVECISHPSLSPLLPFGWSNRLDLGGGRLYNNFPHKLSIVLHVLDATVTAVNGEVRYDVTRSPVVSGVHDFRKRGQFAPQSEDEPGLEWEDADADSTYTVLARIGPKAHPEQSVSALFKHGSIHPRFDPDHIAFYGRDAAIHISGNYASGPLHLCPRNGKWEEIPLPKNITETLPDIEHPSFRNWAYLAREFVSDIQGQGYAGYQTFKDGWIFQEAFEAVRAGAGWVELPSG